MFNNRVKKIDSINKLKNHGSLKSYVIGKCSEQYLDMKKIIVSDCDGIITTNESFYTCDGKTMKSYGCYDKEMMNIMKSIGWEFVFVTADMNGYSITKKRIDDIGAELKVMNALERAEYVKRLKNEYDVVVFIGDSVSDIDAMVNANYCGTAYNAPSMVKDFCDYVSALPSGYGGFADIVWNIHDGVRDI